MRGKTILASFVTLFFLCGFVFATFAAIAIGSSQTDVLTGVLLGIAVTVAWSLLTWLLAPLLMDLVQYLFYSARTISFEELATERPVVAAFVKGVCDKHRIKIPTLKMIADQTPQAYCYGAYANNARLVMTRGMLHYLDDEELNAVYGHELGHIVHRDFIVMTIAATLLNILWNTYVIAKNIRGKNNSRPAMPIALIALVFWWVAQYMLLFLSRTREYYADEFAAQETGNPNALSMALVKIAYGMTREQGSPLQQKLLGGTRAMGIADFKSVRTTGLAFGATQKGAPAPGAAAAGYAQAAYGQPGYAPASAATTDSVRRIEKVMLFDLYNPWATVSELGSTHPLTGKRIRALGEQAKARGQAPLCSFERVDANGQALDTSRLMSSFLFELVIYFLPHVLGVFFAVVAIAGLFLNVPALAHASFGIVVAAIGLGMTLKGAYRFGPIAQAQPASVYDLMSDPYASPLKGRPVVLRGTVIGRVDAGGKLSEDVMLEDPSGGLMAINYESPFGALGNWWFATRRVGGLMNQDVEVRGWFRRGVSQQVDLKAMRVASTGDEVSSWTAFWGRAAGILVLVAGIALAVFGIASF